MNMEARVSDTLWDARAILQRQRALVTVPLADDETMIVVGDTHGNLDITRHVASKLFLPGRGKTKIMFLGDYVDRGNQDIDNINFVLELLVAHPDEVFLLRGNHEERGANEEYGFMENLASRGMEDAYPLYERVFTELPLAAHAPGQRAFMVHGMIPARAPPVSLDELRAIRKQARLHEWDPITTNMLWSDPDKFEGDETTSSERGVGFNVGRSDIESFCDVNDVDVMIRSHRAYPGPGGFKFFFERVVSVFTGLGTIAMLHGDGRVTVHLARVDHDDFPCVAIIEESTKGGDRE